MYNRPQERQAQSMGRAQAGGKFPETIGSQGPCKIFEALGMGVVYPAVGEPQDQAEAGRSK